MFKIDLFEGEKPVRFYRQTEFVLIKPVLLIFAVIYVPWYLLIKYELVATYRTWILLWTLAVLSYGVRSYLLWLLNVNLLTNRRLLIAVYQGLFRKKVSEAPLERISNVGFATTGLFSSVLGFGEVEVKLEGLSEPIVLGNINSPEQVKNELWQAVAKAAVRIKPRPPQQSASLPSNTGAVGTVQAKVRKIV